MDGIIKILLILVAYIGPFFLIPAAFKYVGGIFTNIGGMVNNGQRGVFDRLRKGRSNSLKGGWQRAQGGTAWKGAGDKGFKGYSNKLLQRSSLAGKAIKSSGAGNLKAGIDKEIRAVKAHELDEFFKDHETGVWRGNDSITGVGSAVLNSDGQGLTEAFARHYAEPEIKRAKSLAETAATSAGYVKGSDEYDEKYNSVLASEEARFMPGVNDRARSTANSVLAMQSRGKFSDALSTALDESGAFVNKDGSVDTAKRNIAVSQVVAAQRKYGNTALARGMVISAMEGGTFYEDEVDTWRAAGLAAHGDDNAEADFVVKGRKALMGAGRGGEGGGSFGATFNLQRELAHLDPSDPKDAKKIEELKFNFASHVIDNNPASTLTHPSMKAKYIEKNIVPVLQKRLDDATKVFEDTGNDEQLIRETAWAENFHAQIKATKPDMAKLFGEKVLGYAPSASGGKVLTNTEEKARQKLMEDYNKDMANYRAQVEAYRIAEHNRRADAKNGKILPPTPVPVEPAQPNGPVSVRMKTHTYSSDARYQNYSRQFNSAEELARSQQGQALATQQNQPPGGGPVGGGPVVPTLP